MCETEIKKEDLRERVFETERKSKRERESKSKKRMCGKTGKLKIVSFNNFCEERKSVEHEFQS